MVSQSKGKSFRRFRLYIAVMFALIAINGMPSHSNVSKKGNIKSDNGKKSTTTPEKQELCPCPKEDPRINIPVPETFDIQTISRDSRPFPVEDIQRLARHWTKRGFFDIDELRRILKPGFYRVDSDCPMIRHPVAEDKSKSVYMLKFQCIGSPMDRYIRILGQDGDLAANLRVDDSYVGWIRLVGIYTDPLGVYLKWDLSHDRIFRTGLSPIPAKEEPMPAEPETPPSDEVEDRIDRIPPRDGGETIEQPEAEEPEVDTTRAEEEKVPDTEEGRDSTVVGILNKATVAMSDSEKEEILSQLKSGEYYSFDESCPLRILKIEDPLPGDERMLVRFSITCIENSIYSSINLLFDRSSEAAGAIRQLSPDDLIIGRVRYSGLMTEDGASPSPVWDDLQDAQKNK